MKRKQRPETSEQKIDPGHRPQQPIGHAGMKQGYALFAAASPVMRRDVALAGWARLIPVLFQRVNISDHAHRVNCSTYFYNIESIK